MAFRPELVALGSGIWVLDLREHSLSVCRMGERSNSKTSDLLVLGDKHGSCVLWFIGTVKGVAILEALPPSESSQEYLDG